MAPAHPVHAPYHDREYGFPETDERVLFERLQLEINQAGLSWLTILSKRAAFRAMPILTSIAWLLLAPRM